MPTKATTAGNETRVLAALAGRPSGMTAGEILTMVLSHVSAAERNEILDALKAAGMVLRGRPVSVGSGRLSSLWVITDRGRKHLEKSR